MTTTDSNPDIETENAVALLEDKGLAAVERPGDEERDYEFDKLLTGRPEALKFEEPGDFASGTIVDKLTQQRKDFDTGEPMWNDDGSPRLDPLVIIMTADGMRTLYMASWRLAKAVGEAVRASGQRRMERGGYLGIRFTGFGEPYKKGALPPKEYEAAYDPPGMAGTFGTGVAAELNAPETGPPPMYRGLAGGISSQCVAGDCKDCDSRKCDHDCHSASKPPAPMATGDSAEIPF